MAPERYPTEGLSPRVRGNRVTELGDVGMLRSIPACAGEPRGRGADPPGGRVYPRVCGGTRHGGAGVRRDLGLSPRVRGNPPHVLTSDSRRGSIPACAGEPMAYLGRLLSPWVYPRVCGGTALTPQALPEGLGLSPRVRGNPSPLMVMPPSQRSIPACAGEPRVAGALDTFDTVYPRVCGGTPYSFANAASDHGLSPRVRGNHELLERAGRVPGSIPACAGEPNRESSGRSAYWVYPRVCGGTLCCHRPAAVGCGLSPRVRGNLRHRHVALIVHGSIPACAGEPRTGTRQAGSCGVYPRVCGGTLSRCRAGPPGRGLSPRVRGNPSRRLLPAS